MRLSSTFISLFIVCFHVVLASNTTANPEAGPQGIVTSSLPSPPLRRQEGDPSQCAMVDAKCGEEGDPNRCEGLSCGKNGICTISATEAATDSTAPCGGEGDPVCCEGSICGPNGTCKSVEPESQPETVDQIMSRRESNSSSQCVMADETCGGDDECCNGLTCDQNRTCKAVKAKNVPCIGNGEKCRGTSASCCKGTTCGGGGVCIECITSGQDCDPRKAGRCCSNVCADRFLGGNVRSERSTCG
ncbi:hypothetical protein L218DRAFT_991335 [Marasmius fiardii PR-910]|nr:hypothetical protein L218DRAFT_991335 [Marasmius fiardii PR-910]